MSADTGITDFSIHEEFVAALSRPSPKYEVEEAKSQSDTMKCRQSLLHAWFSAQLEAIASNTGVDGGKIVTYELALEGVNKSIDKLRHFELSFGKLDFADSVYLDSVKEKIFEKSFSSTVSSLTWMEKAASEVIYRLMVLLSPTSGKLFNSYSLPLPGHVLIYGLPGSGKTSLVTAVAKLFEEHKEILAHIVFISCSALALEKVSTIQEAISSYIF